MDHIVENLRGIMKEKGLKQKYVAEKSGFSEADFSNMMNGRKRIGIEHVCDICNALGIQPNDFFAVSGK